MPEHDDAVHRCPTDAHLVALDHAARASALVGGIAVVAAEASVQIAVAVSSAAMTWPRKVGYIRDDRNARPTDTRIETFSVEALGAAR